MRSFIFVLGVLVVFLTAASAQAQTPSWSYDAEYIEACSCDLFCPCYFGPSPDKDFCKFNMAVRIKEGHYGKTKLNGMKVWITGDLGDNFGDGETEFVQFAFEPSATQEQVDGVLAILGNIYPVRWKKVVGVERTTIEWNKGGDKATAQRGDGKGEMTLTFVKGNDGKSPVVIKNLTYFAAKKNNGFVLAHSKHSAKVGEGSFAFDKATGFFIELISSGGGK